MWKSMKIKGHITWKKQVKLWQINGKRSQPCMLKEGTKEKQGKSDNEPSGYQLQQWSITTKSDSTIAIPIRISHCAKPLQYYNHRGIHRHHYFNGYIKLAFLNKGFNSNTWLNTNLRPDILRSKSWTAENSAFREFFFSRATTTT